MPGAKLPCDSGLLGGSVDAVGAGPIRSDLRRWLARRRIAAGFEVLDHFQDRPGATDDHANLRAVSV